jgi:hypothetical protein
MHLVSTKKMYATNSCSVTLDSQGNVSSNLAKIVTVSLGVALLHLFAITALCVRLERAGNAKQTVTVWLAPFAKQGRANALKMQYKTETSANQPIPTA